MARAYLDGMNKSEHIKKCIKEDMNIKKGDEFTSKKFHESFEKYMTRHNVSWEKNGINASLTKLCVNAEKSRQHYKANACNNDDFLWKIDRSTFRLYDPSTDVINQASAENGIEKKPKSRNNKNNPATLIKHTEAEQFNGITESFDQPDKIKQRIDDLIILINDNCKNKKLEPMFYDKNTREMWRAIEKKCVSKELFINFSLNLYKIIFETTRKENPKYRKNNQESFYLFRLPKEFLKNGTQTKLFVDIVGTLRHKYAHREPEYNVLINKISYPEILKKLLKNIKEPPNYQRLQIKILILFEKSMKILLEMVKKE